MPNFLSSFWNNTLYKPIKKLIIPNIKNKKPNRNIKPITIQLKSFATSAAVHQTIYSNNKPYYTCYGTG